MNVDTPTQQRANPLRRWFSPAQAAPPPEDAERQALLEQLRALRLELQSLFTQVAGHRGSPRLQRRLLQEVALALELDEAVLLPALRDAHAAPQRAIGAAEIDVEVLRDLSQQYENEPEMLGSSARMHLRTMDLLLRSPAAEHDLDWARAHREASELIERWQRDLDGAGD
ncbi:MAG: hypothetical protein IPM15_03760 [Betaproteobacteria bacterium]|nr:hypothetical protein [Betaproteobacteria bacterium]MCC6248917.1 hypothetical protein [Rubrivivax sp.]MCL4697319.1 hypothetical protein [Burkholderiaceae bacterium]